jgi:hypothetical protein
VKTTREQRKAMHRVYLRTVDGEPERKWAVTPEGQAWGATQTTARAAPGQLSLATGGMVPPTGIGALHAGTADGMADTIPAVVDGQQPAALSAGEVVVPADVVSHLGNGNTNAGAKRLLDMMTQIRQARTGSSTQGRRIDPNKFLPR